MHGTRWQLVDQAAPHSCADKLGGTMEEWDRPHKPGFQHMKNKASEPLAVKICGGCRDRINLQSLRRVCWRGPQGPRMYTSPPIGNQHQCSLEGHNSLVGNEGSDWKRGKGRARGIVPSLTPPPHTVPQRCDMGCPALANTYGSSPYNVTGALRQRNMAQMKKQIKTPEKELSHEETANLSDAEFKTLVIRMLTEMIWVLLQVEEVKAMQNEIKIYREPTVKGRKLGLKSMIWRRRKK